MCNNQVVYVSAREWIIFDADIIWYEANIYDWVTWLKVTTLLVYSSSGYLNVHQE